MEQRDKKHRGVMRHTGELLKLLNKNMRKVRVVQMYLQSLDDPL